MNIVFETNDFPALTGHIMQKWLVLIPSCLFYFLYLFLMLRIAQDMIRLIDLYFLWLQEFYLAWVD